MKDLRDILKSIRTRPEMWLTTKTPAALADFLNGWQTATGQDICGRYAIYCGNSKGVMQFNLLTEAIDELIKFLDSA